jgi:hypothetical protein
MGNTVVTDYRKDSNENTLKIGSIQAYRTVHWMCDIMRNFFSDPINVKDDRLCNILFDNGDGAIAVNIGQTYGANSKYAGTTPAIVVSYGGTAYPDDKRALNALGGGRPLNVATTASVIQMHKVMSLTVTVITEKYDGTLLLGSVVEDFLLKMEWIAPSCNPMMNEFTVKTAGDIQQVQREQQGNAKDLYAMPISIQAKGTVSWAMDTQGPVFRGVTANVSVI